MRRLAITSLAAPDPPSWWYVLYENHPTAAQRLALSYAWERLARGR